MTASCICGSVAISIVRKPEFIHDCDCGLCRKAGAAWGYFTSSDVTVSGRTLPFVRTDKPGAAARVHSCGVCGATTHFDLTESFKAENPSADQVGVNMRLFGRLDLDGVEVRYPDGANWDGEGEFGYRRGPMVIREKSPL